MIGSKAAMLAVGFLWRIEFAPAQRGGLGGTPSPTAARP
jgi:hypothetical protein